MLVLPSHRLEAAPTLPASASSSSLTRLEAAPTLPASASSSFTPIPQVLQCWFCKVCTDPSEKIVTECETHADHADHGLHWKLSPT